MKIVRIDTSQTRPFHPIVPFHAIQTLEKLDAALQKYSSARDIVTLRKCSTQVELKDKTHRLYFPPELTSRKRLFRQHIISNASGMTNR